MRTSAYFLAASLSVLDEDEAPLGDVDDELLGVPAAPGDDIDEELDELPGVLAELPVAEEVELVSGVVLPDGVVLLLADDEGVVLLDDDGVDVLDEDDVAGGLTVTLVDEDVDLSDGVSGALLQAASDSADSRASASIEGRFIRGLLVMVGEVGVAGPSRRHRVTCPTSVGRPRRRPYRAPSEPVVGGSRRCGRFLHRTHAKSSEQTGERMSRPRISA